MELKSQNILDFHLSRTQLLYQLVPKPAVPAISISSGSRENSRPGRLGGRQGSWHWHRWPAAQSPATINVREANNEKETFCSPFAPPLISSSEDKRGWRSPNTDESMLFKSWVVTFDQSDEKTKRQRPKREFYILISGQFYTAMFYVFLVLILLWFYGFAGVVI